MLKQRLTCLPFYPDNNDISETIREINKIKLTTYSILFFNRVVPFPSTTSNGRFVSKETIINPMVNDTITPNATAIKR